MAVQYFSGCIEQDKEHVSIVANGSFRVTHLVVVFFTGATNATGGLKCGVGDGPPKNFVIFPFLAAGVCCCCWDVAIELLLKLLIMPTGGTLLGVLNERCCWGVAMKLLLNGGLNTFGCDGKAALEGCMGKQMKSTFIQEGHNLSCSPCK